MMKKGEKFRRKFIKLNVIARNEAICLADDGRQGTTAAGRHGGSESGVGSLESIVRRGKRHAEYRARNIKC
jgi:hypothetical protein